MPRYRVHLLDRSGKVIGVGQFECINSLIAQERIKQLAGDLDSELWELVSSFGPGTKPRSEVEQAEPIIRRRLNS